MPNTRRDFFKAAAGGSTQAVTALAHEGDKGSRMYVEDQNMKLSNSVSLLMFTLLLPMAVLAQQGKRPDPADPMAVVPAIKYESTFSDYRPFQEQKVAPWKQVLDEVAGVPGATGHAGHGGMAMAEASTAEKAAAPATTTATKSQTPGPAPETSTDAPAVEIAASGLILQIDKANGKVKIAHDPIAALGWPKMTMFFRLKDVSLADQTREGTKVDFVLEKTPAGYAISRFGKPTLEQEK